MEQWKSQGRLTFQSALKQNVESSSQKNIVDTIISEPIPTRSKNKSINKTYYEDSKENVTRTLTSTIDHEQNLYLQKKKRPIALMNKFQLSLAGYIQEHKTDVKFSGTKRFCDKSGEYYLKTVLIEKHPDKGSAKILPKLSLREPTSLVNCIKKCNGLQSLRTKANEILTVMPKNSLTPIPTMNKKSIKSTFEGKELSNAERTAVHIRRLEYSTEVKRMEKLKPMSQSMQAIILLQKWWKSIFAVIRIQRYYRGWIFRKNLMELLENEENLIEKLLGFEHACCRVIMRRFIMAMNGNKPLSVTDEYDDHKENKMLDMPMMNNATIDHNEPSSGINNNMMNTIDSTISNNHYSNNNGVLNSNAIPWNMNPNVNTKNMGNYYAITQPNCNHIPDWNNKSKSSNTRKNNVKKIKNNSKGSNSSSKIANKSSNEKKKLNLKEIALMKSYFNAWKTKNSIEKKHKFSLLKLLKQNKEKKLKEEKMKEDKLKIENAKKQKVKEERMRKEKLKEDKAKDERLKAINPKIDKALEKIKLFISKDVLNNLKQLKAKKVKEKKYKTFENTLEMKTQKVQHQDLKELNDHQQINQQLLQPEVQQYQEPQIKNEKDNNQQDHDQQTYNKKFHNQKNIIQYPNQSQLYDSKAINKQINQKHSRLQQSQQLDPFNSNQSSITQNNENNKNSSFNSINIISNNLSNPTDFNNDFLFSSNSNTICSQLYYYTHWKDISIKRKILQNLLLNLKPYFNQWKSYTKYKESLSLLLGTILSIPHNHIKNKKSIPTINLTRNHVSSNANVKFKKEISSISEREENESSIDRHSKTTTPRKDNINVIDDINHLSKHINEIENEEEDNDSHHSNDLSNAFVYLKKKPHQSNKNLPLDNNSKTPSENTDFNEEQLDTNANFIQYDETLSPHNNIKLRAMSNHIILTISNNFFEIKSKKKALINKIIQTHYDAKSQPEMREICIGTDDEERIRLMNKLLRKNDLRKYYYKWMKIKKKFFESSPIIQEQKDIEIELGTDTLLEDIMLINGNVNVNANTSNILKTLSPKKAFNLWNDISMKNKIRLMLQLPRSNNSNSTINNKLKSLLQLLTHIINKNNIISYEHYMTKWARITNAFNYYDCLVIKLQSILTKYYNQKSYNKIKGFNRPIMNRAWKKLVTMIIPGKLIALMKRKKCIKNLQKIHRKNILYDTFVQYYTQAKAMTLDEQESFIHKIRNVIYHNQCNNVISLIKQRAAIKFLITMKFKQSLECQPELNEFDLLNAAFENWKKNSLPIKSSCNINIPIINIPIHLNDEDNNEKNKEGDGEIESSPLSFRDSSQSQSCHTSQSFHHRKGSLSGQYPIQSYRDNKSTPFNHYTHHIHTSINKNNRRNQNSISVSNPIIRSNQNFSFGDPSNRTSEEVNNNSDTLNTSSPKEFNLIQTKKETLKPTIYSSQSFYFQKDNHQQKSKVKLHSNFYSMFNYPSLEETKNLKNPRIQAIKATIPVDSNDNEGNEGDDNNSNDKENYNKEDAEEENEETDTDKKKIINNSTCNKSSSRREKMSDEDIQKNIMDNCYKDINYGDQTPIFVDGNTTDKRKYNFTFPIKEKTAFHRISRSNEHTEVQKLTGNTNSNKDNDNIKTIALINYGLHLNMNKSSNCHKRNSTMSSIKKTNGTIEDNSIKASSRSVERTSYDEEGTFTLKEMNSSQFYHSPTKSNNSNKISNNDAGIYTTITKNRKRGKMPIFHPKMKNSINSDMTLSFLSMTLPPDNDTNFKHGNEDEHNNNTENDLSNDYEHNMHTIRRSITQSNIHSNINNSYKKIKHCDSMSNTARRNMRQNSNINLNLNKERLLFTSEPPKTTLTTRFNNNTFNVSSHGGNIFDPSANRYFESISDSYNDDLNKTQEQAPKIIQSKTIWFREPNEKSLLSSNSSMISHSANHPQPQNISLKIKWKQTNFLLSTAYYLHTHKMILLRRMMMAACEVQKYHNLCYLIKVTLVQRGSFQVKLIKKFLNGWKKTLRKYSKKPQGAFRMINNNNPILFIDGKNKGNNGIEDDDNSTKQQKRKK